MKHLLTFIVLLLLMVGCKSAQPIAEHSESTDSVRVSISRLDSLVKLVTTRDSIYTRDTRYVERTKYKYIYRDKDNSQKEIQHDTTYVTRTDSVYITKQIPIAKPDGPLDKGFKAIGMLCSIAFILWLLFLYLKRKF